MVFDLKQFLQTGRTPYETAFACDLSGWDWPGYAPCGPVKASFSAIPGENGAELQLTVSAGISAACARCLEPVRQEHSFSRQWQVREQDLFSEELELPISEKGALDLDELIFEELVLEVPPVLLCSPDCEGVCPVCGTPKAAGCSCCTAGQSAPADARLAILKELLSE